MSGGVMLATTCLLALAAAHSALGERMLIGPLLAAAPFPRLRVPADFAKQTLRFAWHLTSLAWVALAWALVESPAVAGAVAALLIVSGVLTHASTGGVHFAWAVFLAGGLGALHAAVPTGAGVVVVAWVTATTLGGVAAIHLAWALGLTWGLTTVVPDDDGRPLFTPSKAITVVVAAALLVTAVLVLSLAGVVTQAPFARGLGWTAALCFGVRAVGDRRAVGLLKRASNTRFARWDSLLFTPLCFALGAAFVWVLGS